MPDPKEDDLFRESTMTFGEHLGELRVCLFKSIYGLAIGFVVGLAIGGYVVDFIQRPLFLALDRYYQQESQKHVNDEMAKLDEAGQTRTWSAEQVKKFVEKEHLLVQEFYVDPEQVVSELKRVYPDRFKDLEPPQRVEKPESDPTQGFLRLFVWHLSKHDPRLRSHSFGTTEAFTIYIKTSLLVGLLLASPWIFYQIWNFVAAGLYKHERRYVLTYLPFSIGLFLFGAAIAFFVVFEPVLDFLMHFNSLQGIDYEPRINDWFSFVLILPVGFGVGFQLPLVMLFLERIGVFTIQSYISQWRFAVIVIFILGAVLMPPDATSMILFAISLSILYFGGVLLCKYLPRKSSPFEK